MAQPEEKKTPPSKTIQVCAIAFMAAGIAGFQVAAPTLFPAPPGGGFNLERVIGAGVVGGACALLGAGVGKLIDSMRK